MSNQTPTQPIIRMGDVTTWLGVDSQAVEKWVECGLLTVFQPTPESRRWFYTDEIATKILQQPLNGNGKHQ